MEKTCDGCKHLQNISLDDGTTLWVCGLTGNIVGEISEAYEDVPLRCVRYEKEG